LDSKSLSTNLARYDIEENFVTKIQIFVYCADCRFFIVQIVEVCHLYKNKMQPLTTCLNIPPRKKHIKIAITKIPKNTCLMNLMTDLLLAITHNCI
jgi:hypothetical protein